MRTGSLIALIGFIVLIAATWSPLLCPLHLFNWNVYELNKTYGVVLLLVGFAGAAGAFFNQIQITRYLAAIALILVVLLYFAAVLKVDTAFSFIPFKSMSRYLAGQIKFKWGWLLLFSGSFLAFAGVFSIKKQIVRR